MTSCGLYAAVGRRCVPPVLSAAMASVPAGSVRALRAIAATADQVATQAAMAMFDRGGNAVDAAIAANAAIAVTAPHLCGMGGDLFALVRTADGEVVGLDASGHAALASDAAAMRAEGLTEVPLRHDIRAVTVPGCVDGWVHLHERFASLDLATILAPAIRLAGVRVPGQPAARGVARHARRRSPAALPRARRAGDERRGAGAPARSGADAARHRRRRSRGVLQRGVRGGSAPPGCRSLRRGRPRSRRRPTGSTRWWRRRSASTC